MLKTFTGLLKPGTCTSNSLTHGLFHPNILCRTIIRPPGRTNRKIPKPKDEKSEWLQLNDKIYPPQLPNEEPRPAFVCHELLNVKYPPKKMWVVACYVRGMSVDEALKQLASAKRKGAIIVSKAIEDAVEMAIREHNVEFRSNLWVAESFVHPGLIMTGLRRRGRGIISKIRYRYCNYYLRLEEGQPPEDYYCRNAKWTAPQMFSDWMEQMRKRRVSNSL